MSHVSLLYSTGKFLYGLWAGIRFRVKREGFEKLSGLKPPYIIYSNHVHIQDVLLLGTYWPEQICFVTGAHLFDHKILGHCLKRIKAISKAQGHADLETITGIRHALEDNNVVAIFPEGTRTWDGNTRPVPISAAKLIRIFKVPVVFVNFIGGYRAKPRWSEAERKVPLTLKVRSVWMPEEFANEKADKILEHIQQELWVSDEQWTEHPAESRHLAEGLERAVYFCPACGSISELETEGCTVRCRKCGASSVMDGFGHLSGKLGTETVSEWMKSDREKIRSDLKEKKLAPFPEDKCIFFREGRDKLGKGKLAKNCRISADSQKLVITHSGGSPYVFSWDDVESLIVAMKQTLEFYVNGKLYRARISSDANAIKYADLFDAVVSERSEN